MPLPPYFFPVVFYDKLTWHTYRLPYILLYGRSFDRVKATYYKSNHFWLSIIKIYYRPSAFAWFHCYDWHKHFLHGNAPMLECILEV